MGFKNYGVSARLFIFGKTLNIGETLSIDVDAKKVIYKGKEYRLTFSLATALTVGTLTTREMTKNPNTRKVNKDGSFEDPIQTVYVVDQKGMSKDEVEREMGGKIEASVDVASKVPLAVPAEIVEVKPEVKDMSVNHVTIDDVLSGEAAESEIVVSGLGKSLLDSID